MLQLVAMLLSQLLLMLIVAYELLQQLWLRLHALACRSYDYWQCDNRELFERAAHELQKLPQHLVLVVAPDDRYVDASLLKRIFGYAQSVGIPHLSVYDKRSARNGHVELSRLCQASEKGDKCYLWPPRQRSDHQVQLNGSKTAIGNGSTNGYAVNGAQYAQLQVYQIGTADGHALIADVCRELYAKRRTPQVQALLKQRQSLTDEIDARLNQRLGIAVPEPELGIVFSRLTCTYGLLPWHARFTEFHTHHTGRHFNANSFLKVLYKYARCEQRWGK